MAKFDQKQQNVGHQVNIGGVEGPVTIYTTPTPTADSYFQRGLELLRICNYPEASRAIEAAIAISPSPGYFYYHALALLRGRRPKILIKSEADVIVNDLIAASNSEEVRSQYLYLLAMVVDDFYLANYLLPPVDVQIALEIAKSLPVDTVPILELLKHIPVENNRIKNEMLKRL